MLELDDLDKRLLTLVQKEFPMVPRPYASLALSLGIEEEEVMDRIKRLKAGKVIRQVSAIFDTRSLGYQSSLVAMKIPAERLNEAAKIINEHPGVSHNYKRNHEFNLWFTIAVPPGSPLEGTIERLHELAGAESTRMMPTIRLFKISVTLDMTGDEPLDAQGPPQYSQEIRNKAEGSPLSPEDIAVIRELQEDIPVVTAPFARSARRLGISEEVLLARGEALKERGHLRRFAAILFHRRSGFTANGMAVWRVPVESVKEIGETMGSFNAVTHCYERPTYPDWPYNVFTMIHGRKVVDCQRVAEAISQATGVQDYTMLYSTKEYKKTRVSYFTPEMEEWESRYLLLPEKDQPVADTALVR
ncbi:MAG: putative transcriptional regulator, AsnC family [Dehalococcoidia bacterium]|nr:putative transcriptional regulator, AsnC family [Dehalococcoidia bacterium]